jgi:Sulfotransferase family
MSHAGWEASIGSGLAGAVRPVVRDDTGAPMAYAAPDMSAGPNVDPIAANAILIVGAPRSGTTWLAKIFDSHPEVIYRHEPDEVVPACGPIQASMEMWVRQHDARTAGKRPFFKKSWQAAPARLLRSSLACAGAAANRIGLPAWPIPDLGDISRARVVIKSVRLSTGIGDFARAYPEGRTVLILRHPCGQVASVMRGTRDRRFALAEPGTDMPFDEAGAVAFAARHGVGEEAFQRLPNAAKYAWSWRAFNETSWASFSGQNNVRVVVYEDLCARPAAEARAFLEFAKLTWHSQTETFLARSTNYDGPAGYYAVVRNSIAAAERWRTSMAREDQDAVRAVVRDSPLGGYWPDLVV